MKDVLKEQRNQKYNDYVKQVTPVHSLAFCTLIYKAMAALVQPVGDKRLNECVAAVAEGVGLLLKIMVSSSMLFFLTIAIVTASLGK